MFLNEGTHIGVQTALERGETTSFTYFLAFGQTPLEAQAAFSAAAVPEPGSIALLCSGVGAFAARRRR